MLFLDYLNHITINLKKSNNVRVFIILINEIVNIIFIIIIIIIQILYNYYTIIIHTLIEKLSSLFVFN